MLRPPPRPPLFPYTTLFRSERRGTASASRPQGPLVWIHAASVGEATSVLGFIEQLLSTRPSLEVLITTGTVTSARLLRSEEHTSELQSLTNLVCRLLLEKKN